MLVYTNILYSTVQIFCTSTCIYNNILYIYYYTSYTLTQVPQYTNDIAMLLAIQSQPALIA